MVLVIAKKRWMFRIANFLRSLGKVKKMYFVLVIVLTYWDKKWF